MENRSNIIFLKTVSIMVLVLICSVIISKYSTIVKENGLLSTFFTALTYYMLFDVSSTILVKIYNVSTTGVCTSKNRMDGKVVLVTGANTGIGKRACIDFAQRGARVIMACRNLSWANSTRDKIVASTGNDNIIVYHLDLSSLESVRQFAKNITSNEEKLDVLINNAGGACLKRKKTKDNLELGLQINYYGHFLLTLLLIDLLKKSTAARIIHVSSLLHLVGKLHFEDVIYKNSIVDNWQVYSDSKLNLVMFNVELARRLEGTGITTNTLHPGAVNTQVWRKFPFALKVVIKYHLIKYFKCTDEGAQTTIHLAVSDKVANVSGKYFADCNEATASKLTQNLAKTKKLWDMSCVSVGLKPEEIMI